MTQRLEPVLPAIAVALVLGLFVVSARASQPFVGNQNTYYPHGLRLGGAAYLEHDWFANTRPPHRVFTAAVAWAEHRGVTESWIRATRGIVQSALLLGLAAFALAPGRRRAGARASPGAALSGVAALFVYVLAVRRIGLPAALHPGPPGDGGALVECLRDLLQFSGLAGQTLHSDALEPASFGAFALLGLGAFRLGWWRSGAVALAVAALFHPTYLPHAGVALAASAAVLAWRGDRAAAWQSFAVFALLAAPSALDAGQFAWAARDAGEALRILATERIPHHTLPAHWFDRGDALRLALIGLAGAALVRGAATPRVAAFLALFAFALLGVSVASFVDSPRVALLFPWRSTTLLFPIASVVLLRAAIEAAVEHAARGAGTARFVPFAWAVLIAAVLASSVHAARHPRDAFRAFPAVDEFADRVREATPEDAIVLVPARLAFQGFRLRAQRALPVDYKSHPYLPTEVVEWRRRVQWVRSFHEAPASERLRECKASGATHYAIAAGQRGPEELAVAATDDYALIACPGATTARPLAARAPASRASAHSAAAH